MTPLESTIKWGYAWEIAYRIRANAYGPIMPPSEHRKMMIAGARMDAASRREETIRKADLPAHPGWLCGHCGTHWPNMPWACCGTSEFHRP